VVEWGVGNRDRRFRIGETGFMVVVVGFVVGWLMVWCPFLLSWRN